MEAGRVQIAGTFPLVTVQNHLLTERTMTTSQALTNMCPKTQIFHFPPFLNRCFMNSQFLPKEPEPHPSRYRTTASQGTLEVEITLSKEHYHIQQYFSQNVFNFNFIICLKKDVIYSHGSKFKRHKK